VILHVDRLALEEEVIAVAFPGRLKADDLPTGASLRHWKARFDQFHLVVTGPSFAALNETLREAYLLPSQ